MIAAVWLAYMCDFSALGSRGYFNASICFNFLLFSTVQTFLFSIILMAENNTLSATADLNRPLSGPPVSLDTEDRSTAGSIIQAPFSLETVREVLNTDAATDTRTVVGPYANRLRAVTEHGEAITITSAAVTALSRHKLDRSLRNYVWAAVLTVP